jgi:hypothetical protein
MPKNTKSSSSAKTETVAHVESVPAPVVEAAPKQANTKKVKAEAAPVAAPAVAVPQAATEQAQDGGRRVRYFKCIYNDATFGRFSGYKPAACKKAASKALTSILRSRNAAKQDVSVEIPFSMVECTRGRTHKVSQYIGKREELDTPITVNIKSKNADGSVTNKTIQYKFKNKIVKVKNAAPTKTAKKATKAKKETKSTTSKAKKEAEEKTTKAKKEAKTVTPKAKKEAEREEERERKAEEKARKEAEREKEREQKAEEKARKEEEKARKEEEKKQKQEEKARKEAAKKK